MLVLFSAENGMTNALGGKNRLPIADKIMTAATLSAANAQKSSTMRVLQQEVFIRNSRRRFAVLDAVQRTEEQEFTGEEAAGGSTFEEGDCSVAAGEAEFRDVHSRRQVIGKPAGVVHEEEVSRSSFCRIARHERYVVRRAWFSFSCLNKSSRQFFTLPSSVGSTSMRLCVFL